MVVVSQVGGGCVRLCKLSGRREQVKPGESGWTNRCLGAAGLESFDGGLKQFLGVTFADKLEADGCGLITRRSERAVDEECPLAGLSPKGSHHNCISRFAG